MLDNRIVDKKPCPNCRDNGGDNSGDNLNVYNTGTGYCFVCDLYFKDVDSKEGLSVVQNKIGSEFKQGRYTELVKRNISEQTCIKYGYQIGDDCHIANLYDEAGNVVFQKIRKVSPKKSFISAGDKQKVTGLYGSWLFTPNPKCFITVTEGELDALSIYEAFQGDFDTPVVSVISGAAAAKAEILKNLDYLQSFKYVVLAFDNDEPGRKALSECVPLFEPGKVRVANWPSGYKDASDMLQENKKLDIRKIIYRAKAWMPEPIKTGTSLMDSLNGYSYETIPWPWKNANNTIIPIHKPAVYSLAAYPAVGKTAFCAAIMQDVIARGGKIGIIALEETLQKVLLKCVAMLTGNDFTKITGRELTEEEKEKCREVSEHLVIYDHITYGSDISQICASIPHMVRTCECEIVIFDNLSYSATHIDGDERIGIDKAMVALKDSTVKYNYTLFNVCHLNKEGDIRGSTSVDMYSDYVFTLSRDKDSSNSKIRNTLWINVTKDRQTGEDIGKSFSLFYDVGTKKLVDSEEQLA